MLGVQTLVPCFSLCIHIGHGIALLDSEGLDEVSSSWATW